MIKRPITKCWCRIRSISTSTSGGLPRDSGGEVQLRRREFITLLGGAAAAWPLAALAPDVILTSGASTAGMMLQATRTVPIVFVGAADPVGAGFVDSLARPRGNATGFTSYEYSMSGSGWSCSKRSRRL